MATKKPQDTQETPSSTDQHNGVVSLVLGIISIVIPIIGIVTGIIAIVYSRKQKKIAPSGMATAGMILGIIGIVLWVLYLLLIIIGIIAYFGVLSPEKFLPSKCVLEPGLSCMDFRVTPNSLTLTIRNSLGYGINVDSIKAQQCTDLGNQGVLANGASATFNLKCVNPGSDYYGELTIDYSQTETNLKRTAYGQITAKIE